MTTTLTLTLTDRHISAFCSAYNYPATLPNGKPNPQSQEDFAVQQVLSFIESVATADDMQTATNAARTAVMQAAESQPKATATKE